MTSPPSLALIAAVARNNVIGAGNALPWRLPGDLRRFKATTMGRPVLMGRKTYTSIGRPLPGRTVVVVSRDTTFAPAGVVVARSLADALAQATAIAVRDGVGEIMVAGGGEIYAALIGQAERLYLTEVDAEPAGDTLFPPIEPDTWRVIARHVPSGSPGDDIPHTFVTYARR